MNWLQLRTATRNWANRDNAVLPDSILSTMLEMAEQRIYNGRDGLAIQSMLATNAVFTPGAMPTRYLKMDRVAWITGGRRQVLQYLPSDAFGLIEGQSGSPEAYTIRGNTLFVAPGSQAVEIVYYSRPALMSADTDTNPVIDAYPSVYLYAMLSQVGEFLRDSDMMAQYLPLMQAARRDAQADDEKMRRGGTPLVITSDQLVRS